jgi:hypothetical protein
MAEWYPTTVMFRELPPVEQAIRLETAAELLELCRFWRGDPRLDSWQEGFLTGMTRTLQETEGKARISDKQWAKFREIQDLMERDTGPPDEADGAADE